MKIRNPFLLSCATTCAVIVACALTACGKGTQAESTGGAPLMAGQAENAKREVNDANCQFDALKQIEDKAEQQEFASQCQRRGTFKPTAKKSW